MEKVKVKNICKYTHSLETFLISLKKFIFLFSCCMMCFFLCSSSNFIYFSSTFFCVQKRKQSDNIMTHFKTKCLGSEWSEKFNKLWVWRRNFEWKWFDHEMQYIFTAWAWWLVIGILRVELKIRKFLDKMILPMQLRVKELPEAYPEIFWENFY